MKIILLSLLTLILLGWGKQPDYDVIIRNGIIYDGSGGKSYKADLAINGDTITAVGDLSNSNGRIEIDASGLAISPGFINMLSWANESLIEDGRMVHGAFE